MDYTQIEPTDFIKVNLLEFELSHLIDMMQYIVDRYCDRLHLHPEKITINRGRTLKLIADTCSTLYEQMVVDDDIMKEIKQSPTKSTVIGEDTIVKYEDRLKQLITRTLSVTYNVTHQFTPQIQVYDDDISVRKGLVRYNNFVWSLSGTYKSSNMLLLIAAIMNSMVDALTELTDITPHCDYPEIAEYLKEGELTKIYTEAELNEMNPYFVAAMQNVSDKIIMYDNEFATWAGAYGRSVGSKRVAQGVFNILADHARWVCNIFIPRSCRSLADELVSIWRVALEGETDLWKKRLRLIEHLINPIVDQLVTISLPIVSSKDKLKTVTNINLLEHWYQTGLFIHNTVSNPLGMAALRTRTTLKGSGGFKELPFDLRLVDTKLIDLDLCPIDTGDRENAGAVHYYTDTTLYEAIYDSPYTNLLISAGLSLRRPIDVDKLKTYIDEPTRLVLKHINEIFYHKNEIEKMAEYIDHLIKDGQYYQLLKQKE